MPSAAMRPGAGLIFADGLVMPPLLPPPAPPHHQGKAWLSARGEAECCDPTTACLSLPCLGLLAAFEAGMSHSGRQPLPTAVWRGRECWARESNIQLPQRKASPVPGGCARATRSCPSVVLSLVHLNVNGVRHNDFWKEKKKVIFKNNKKRNKAELLVSGFLMMCCQILFLSIVYRFLPRLQGNRLVLFSYSSKIRAAGNAVLS